MSFCHRSLPIVPTGLRIYCCPVSYHIKTFRRKYCACGDLRMPVYELLCLARPLLAKQAVQSMMSKVGRMVYVQGGVVTDIKSYGEQSLAYKIKGVQDKYDKVCHRSAAVSACDLQDQRIAAPSISGTCMTWVNRRFHRDSTPDVFHCGSAGSYLAARFCCGTQGARRHQSRDEEQRGCSALGHCEARLAADAEPTRSVPSPISFRQRAQTTPKAWPAYAPLRSAVCTT